MPKAPSKQSQAQPSRKSKSAWRKNIDLAPVEERLEVQRQAEALGLAGGVGQAGDLFVEDRKGDEALLRKNNQQNRRRTLKSLEVLNRDAVGVPAVLSRHKAGGLGGKTPEERSGMSAKQIAKLRRLTGRQSGPFGAIVEQSQEDKEEQRAKADIQVAAYDVWGNESKGHVTKSLKHDLEKGQVKDVPLPLPDPGQSYNPPAEAHDALLEKAMKVAEDEEKERIKHREWKRKWDAGGEYARQEDEEGKNVMGMRVDGEEENEDEVLGDEQDVETLTTKRKDPKRKTKAHRARILKHKEGERQRLLQKSLRSTHQAIQSLPSLKKSLAKAAEEKQVAAQRRRENKAKRLEGRVGPFNLPKQEQEVQLGEELSEGLRGLKPEGNPFRDRMHGFAKRGLVEPRAPSTKEPRRAATKTYETHAYKRFH